MRNLCGILAIVAVLAWPALTQAHPHNENPIVTLTGALTVVDLKTQTIQMTALDPETKSTRTMVLFLDPKIKVRNGKRPMAIAELAAGDRVRCMAERELDHDSRLVAFEISIEKGK